MSSRLLLTLLLLPLACKPAQTPVTQPPVEAPVEDTTTPSVEPEPEPPREPDDLSDLLTPIVERMQVPGLGAAVVDREGLVAIGVAGRRRIDREDPLQRDDRFHLGSDTKAMTAFMVGRLIDADALRWDDTLGALMPDVDMHKKFAAVTVDQLLTQQGGFPPNPPEGIEQDLDPESTPADQRTEIARRVLANKPAQPPGTFLYSNLGYIVLGAALQARTGESWERLMEREVFEPLDMTSCGFGPVGTEAAPEANWAHNREGGDTPYIPIEGDNPAFFGPAGTVHCTLEDWGRFAQSMFDDSDSLTPTTRERLGTAIDNENYARGWMVSDAFPVGEPVLAHDGSNTLNYASIVIAPKRGLAMMTACNAGDPAAQGAAVDAMLTVLKRYGRPAHPADPKR